MAAPWLIAAAWALLRLAFPPGGHNTHTIMYPLVEAAGSYNTLEPFHPLYQPVVVFVRWAWETFGGRGPALPALEAVSLLAGMANIVLLHRLTRRLTGKDGAAAGAAVLLATSQNLWAWSLMTTSYTISTAFVIAAADRVLGHEQRASKDHLWAGIFTGLAAGFDTAAGLAALPILWEARRSRECAAAFGGGLIVVLAGSYALFVHRLSLLGWPFTPTLQGFVDSLPHDIVPLWKSFDLPAQFRAVGAADAPVDFVWLLAPFIIAFYPPQTDRRPFWFGGTLWAAMTLFFFVNDPNNRFVYASAVLMPALAVVSFPKLWPGIAVAALAFNAFCPPRYLPPDNTPFDEAEFLAARLGPRDLLVALSDPDWLLAYGLAGRVPVLKLARPGDERGLFGQRVAPAGAAAEDLMDETLCRGGRVLFAQDALYRSSRFNAALLDKDAAALVARWEKRYRAAPALVSPQNQHYMPLAPKPGFCAKEGKA